MITSNVIFIVFFFFVALTYIYLIFAIVLSMFIEFIVRNGPHGGIDSVIVEKKRQLIKQMFFKFYFFMKQRILYV